MTDRTEGAARAAAERAAAVTAWLGGPDGSAHLAAAVTAALAATGAPTRPGGPPGRLGDRLARREPLCEDTDWECALGPFRDTSIVRGTLGELCAARLTDLSFGLGILVRSLAPPATVALAGLLDGVDDADERRQVSEALADVLLGPLRTLPLRSSGGVATGTLLTSNQHRWGGRTG